MMTGNKSTVLLLGALVAGRYLTAGFIIGIVKNY